MLEHMTDIQKEQLLAQNTEFRKLYHRHRKLDKQAKNADLGVLPLDAMALGELKREKLRTKTQLTHMLSGMQT